MKYRSIKIRTPDPKTCAAVQKFLFQQGCSWGRTSVEVTNLHAQFLFVDSRGTIEYGSTESFFLNRTPEYEEVIFETESVLTVKNFQLKNRPKTVLFGKTYYTDELNARLAGLETAS